MHLMTGSVKTIIVEYGFLDSEHDFKLLIEKKEREKFAEAVVEMCDWLGYDYHATRRGKKAHESDPTLYRVK